jgi:hypothetical protein
MENELSSCGVLCGKCGYFGKSCGGCKAVEGKVFWLAYTGESVCSIYNCCIHEKKYANCGSCGKLPCSFYALKDPTKTDEENDRELKLQLERLHGINSEPVQ